MGEERAGQGEMRESDRRGKVQRPDFGDGAIDDDPVGREH